MVCLYDPLFPDQIVPLIFDLDGTKIHPDVNRHISKQVAIALKGQFSFATLEAAQEFGDGFYYRHGNTLYGLLQDGHFTSEQAHGFLAKMHDIHPKAYKYVCRDSIVLNKPLSKLAELTQLYIFTNGTTAHAHKALKVSKINPQLFTAIVGIDQIPYFMPKPFTEAYHGFMRASGLGKLAGALFFEDSAKNLIMGHQFGMKGILVDGPVHLNKTISPHPDAHIFARSPCLRTYLNGLVKHWSEKSLITIGLVFLSSLLVWRSQKQDNTNEYI